MRSRVLAVFILAVLVAALFGCGGGGGGGGGGHTNNAPTADVQSVSTFFQQAALRITEGRVMRHALQAKRAAKLRPALQPRDC